MKTTFPTFWLPFLMMALQTGCGVQPEALQSLREAVDTASNRSSSGAGFRQPGNSNPQAKLVSLSDYEPPHPDREDPFSYPVDALGTSRQLSAVTSVAQIEVLGFANVDEPRVLLRTKSTTKSLAVGELLDGVEVVSIRAPAVELRIGTLVWTATMFDKSRSD